MIDYPEYWFSGMGSVPVDQDNRVSSVVRIFYQVLPCFVLMALIVNDVGQLYSQFSTALPCCDFAIDLCLSGKSITACSLFVGLVASLYLAAWKICCSSNESIYCCFCSGLLQSYFMCKLVVKLRSRNIQK